MPRVLLFEFLLQPFSSHRLRAAQQPAVLQSVSLVGLPPVADRILLVVAVLLGPSPARRRGPELPSILPPSPPQLPLPAFAAVPQRPPVAEHRLLPALALPAAGAATHDTLQPKSMAAHERVRMQKTKIQCRKQKTSGQGGNFHANSLRDNYWNSAAAAVSHRPDSFCTKGRCSSCAPLCIRTIDLVQSGNAPR